MEVGTCNELLLIKRKLDMPFDTDWVARGPLAKNLTRANLFPEGHLEKR